MGLGQGLHIPGGMAPVHPCDPGVAHRHPGFQLFEKGCPLRREWLAGIPAGDFKRDPPAGGHTVFAGEFPLAGQGPGVLQYPFGGRSGLPGERCHFLVENGAQSLAGPGVAQGCVGPPMQEAQVGRIPGSLGLFQKAAQILDTRQPLRGVQRAG